MERDDQEMKRLKTTAFQGDNNNNPPQKCPRCESMNTKFCYYNNYSLSQPRYFCKTCRRYWTQGGTLRNVPVGGGCRKGKRLKTTAAAPAPSAANTAIAANLSSNKELGQTNLMNSGPIGSLYPAGGFLSSLAAIQSFSNTNNSIPQQLPMNHVDLGGFSTSNLNLLNGFNGGVPPFGSNQQRPFYPNGFNPILPDTALWSTISTSTTNSANNSGNINIAANNATATNSATASFPMNPSDNQWQDLSSYGNSPP